ncbi:hypothetical protein [Streptomyces sp. NPDC002057]|uniref:hypothetical protein n=1 Tax=Streptomyces sp. NPDC002057 TaxID=3154664 RepID=UPI0033268D2A
MTRRMQANHRSHRSIHGVEHDEIDACRLGFPCEPKPVPAEPGVLVPATGTVLVVDGVVQDIDPKRTGFAHHPNGGTSYGLWINPPKPVFFEAGKTYRRFVGWSIRAQASDVTERFECTAVEKDGDGRPVAFGRLTVAGTPATRGVDLWYLFHEYEWRNDGWEGEQT